MSDSLRTLHATTHDGTPHQLTPGVLDAAATSVFTEGHCHSLALAIHERTGWPIVGFWTTDEDDDDASRMRHVAVRAPGDVAVDADDPMGIDTLEFRTGWMGEEITVADLRELTTTSEENGNWLDLDLELATPFVEAVLARPGMPPAPAPLAPLKQASAIPSVKTERAPAKLTFPGS